LNDIDSAAPLNFLREPEPVYSVDVDSEPVPVTLIIPEPGCRRLNNVYASDPILNRPPATAPIDVDCAAPENA
jgi:hypothetical protein